MASPSPESQPPTSPPSDDDSSPPPPPDDSQSASPPPSPPPDDPSPPPDDPSPPPEEPASRPPPPPPPSPSSDSSPPPESSSPPSPPSPKSSSSSSPPPPSGSSKPSPPPPPRSALTPPKSSSRPTPSSDSTPASENDSSSSTSSVELPTIIGAAVGTGLLLLVIILLCVVCRRKKKKRPDPMSFYGPSDPSIGSRIQNGYAPAGNFYYPNQHPPEASWHGSPAELSVRLRPPPGMPLSPQGNHPPSPAMPPVASAASPHSSWPPPPAPPPYFSSSDMSSSGFSGSHRPGLPPQHPSMALGFTQSSFSYEELAAATRGFSRDDIVGEGGFGFVFKGVLSNGKETAIKCLKSGSGQGDREFQAEVEIISRVHHRHLVSLEGYCIAGAQRILVYEFVPNKTLEYHLHGKDRPTMDWATRLKIALGSAKGLAYLHEDCHPRIIHRDIKASNILLDDNFEAKVSDFGLAKLTSDNYTHVSTRVMGTFGYLAPEYASSGKLTEKSDTFSFGVMLLELITGRRPVDATGELMEDSLVDWARPLIDSALQSGNFRELADPLLEGDFDPQEMAGMVACAGACTRHSAKRRPKMSQVARALEGESSLDDLNTWNKQTQSAVFGDSTGSGSSSAAFESGSYAADMKKLRKPPTSGQEYASSEYGATSEYGLNPSSSSSSSGDSQEISSHARRNRMHAA